MGKSLSVLIIDDSQDDAELILLELRRGGYDPKYERVDTLDAMIAALDRQEWDLIICDYVMPHLSGPAALVVYNERGLDTPFIVFSGKISEETAVDAMRAGAHDYIIKNNLFRLCPVVERELREAETRKKNRKLEDAFRVSEKRYLNLINNAIVGIYQGRLKGETLYVNNAMARIYEFESPEEMISSGALARFKSPGEIERFIGSLKKTGRVVNFELEAVTKKGNKKNLLISGTLDEGVLSGMVVDITERKQMEEALKDSEEKLRRLAYYDSLTDLPNRATFFECVNGAILAAKAANYSLALLTIFLDRYEDINNTIGYKNGGKVLKEAGQRLFASLKEAGLISVARLSGNKFGVLLEKIDPAVSINVANRVARRLEEPFYLDDLPIQVSPIVGIALFPGHGEDADILIRRADIAMNAAKKAESNLSIYSPSHDQYSPQRLALMAELRTGITNDQLFLVYQPKIGLRSGRVIGVEVLVRWRHPKSGIILPDQFIEPAEHTGLIRQVTSWVLKEALRQFKTWHLGGLEFSIAVNLSVRDLHEHKLVGQVKSLLSACGVKPANLRLEITESKIMADPRHAMEIITGLTSVGVSFSIDDFGTGYSSLSYLKRLPVDELKIDKSFVMNMIQDKDDAMIVRSTIELAHNLGLKVTAEGVEDQETMDRLASLNCDAAQGYFISRPIPDSEFTAWMRKYDQRPGGDKSEYDI